jgi:hypothetical protein
MLPDFRKNIYVWKVPRLRPFVQVRATCRWRWVWSVGGIILTGETEVLGENHYTALVVDGWMSMENWWNDTDRGKLKFSEKNLPQWHSVHLKSHVDWPGIEPGPPRLTTWAFGSHISVTFDTNYSLYLIQLWRARWSIEQCVIAWQMSATGVKQMANFPDSYYQFSNWRPHQRQSELSCLISCNSAYHAAPGYKTDKEVTAVVCWSSAQCAFKCWRKVILTQHRTSRSFPAIHSADTQYKVFLMPLFISSCALNYLTTPFQLHVCYIVR